MENVKRMIEFWDLVKDKMTGAEGYVVARIEHIDGTWTYDLQCLELLDGRPGPIMNLPECRLEVVKTEKKVGFDDEIQNQTI